MTAPIVLLHLSDIHFSRWRSDGSSYDVDVDLRRELERDAVGLCERLGGLTGLVVTGDIAYSADPREYLAAEKWIGKLTTSLKCTEEAVWTVPGNHDVSRKTVEDSEIIKLAQGQLRKDTLSLERLLADKMGAQALFEALKNYNGFAEKFECDFRPNQLVWHDHLPLNDGWTLRLCGLNSTLTSSKMDDPNNKVLVLADVSHRMPNEGGVACLTLCHHPPDWLMDLDATEDLLRNRAHVQLFGHKHRQRVYPIGKMLRITAGAVHPDRNDREWTPRYNVIALAVVPGGLPVLRVTVFGRVWHQASMKFVADTADCGKEGCDYDVPLDPWTPPAPPPPSAGRAKAETAPPASPKGSAMDPARRLTYRFLTLPHHKRVEVAVKLALMADEDAGLSDRELLLRIFARARERRRLAELWQQVESEHSDTSTDPNPFAGR